MQAYVDVSRDPMPSDICDGDATAARLTRPYVRRRDAG